MSATRPVLDSTDVDPDVLAIRDCTWHAWFSGDEATLREVLPEEFLAFDADGGGQLSDLERTIQASRAFTQSGGRLVRLAFPMNRAQVSGDAVLIYTTYEAVLESHGAETTMRGRATEFFVRRDGRWWHPGWHLQNL